MRNYSRGFTLVELMMVVAIISIMATMAVPTYQDHIIRTQVSEATRLADGIKQAIDEYYKHHKTFPADNQTAGVPKPEFLIGNFVTSMQVANGAIHITLGNNINVNAAGKILTIRPATVTGSPDSPMSWLCGYAEPVKGMESSSENRTTLPGIYLSIECRQRS